MKKITLLIVMFCAQWVLSACNSKKHQDKKVTVDPVVVKVECPLKKVMADRASYLGNLFFLASRNYHELDKVKSLEQRLAILEHCKEELALLGRNNGGT